MTPPRANGGRVYAAGTCPAQAYFAREVDRLLARGSEAVPRSLRPAGRRAAAAGRFRRRSVPTRSSRSWSRSRPMWRQRSRNSRTSGVSASAISQILSALQRSLARRSPEKIATQPEQGLGDVLTVRCFPRSMSFTAIRSAASSSARSRRTTRSGRRTRWCRGRSGGRRARLAFSVLPFPTSMAAAAATGCIRRP